MQVLIADQGNRCQAESRDLCPFPLISQVYVRLRFLKKWHSTYGTDSKAYPDTNREFFRELV